MSDKQRTAEWADIGRRGGEAKETNRDAERRTLVDAMPPLDSERNCQRRLALIQDMTIRGLLAGSQAGAAVRACEAFLKAIAAETDRNRMRDLERQIEKLEKQLAASRNLRRVG